jgi:hypothetical protein
MAWIPKGSVQVQRKDGIQGKGAMEMIKKIKIKRQSRTLRFAPNHQNYRSSYHPYALQMPSMPQSWSSSLDMFGYPSIFILVCHMGLYIMEGGYQIVIKID